METSYVETSVNSILLLKERIIKVETLLNKYACLVKKCHELEKSHSELSENERNAKKDAARYLEKYCKLTKKCTALLGKIKNLEQTVKDKTDLVTEHQNELAKLDSLIKIYKTERENYQNIKKDKDFLLTLVWRLLKDSKLESVENKNRKTVDIFFKRFERDLEDLKLDHSRSHKLKKSLKSQSTELDAALFSVELSDLNSVESGFIDIDGAPESVCSVSSEEVVGSGEEVGELRVKSNHSCIDGKHENNASLFAESGNKLQNSMSIFEGGLFESSSVEKFTKIQTEDFCFEVRSSIDKDLTNGDSLIEYEGWRAADSKHSANTSLDMVDKPIEVQKNESSCNFVEKNCIFFQSSDKMKESDPKETLDIFSRHCDRLHHSSTSNEDTNSRVISKTADFPCKQYGMKSTTMELLDVNIATVKSITNPNVNDLCGMERTSVIEKTSLPVSVDNDLRGSQMDVDEPETERSEYRKTCKNSLFEPTDVNYESRTNISNVEAQGNFLKHTNKIDECSGRSSEQESFQHRGISVYTNSISNEKMKTSVDDLENKTGTRGVDLEKVPSTESKEMRDGDIFCILEKFKTVRPISPLKEIQAKERCKRRNLFLKPNKKLEPAVCPVKNNLNDKTEKEQTLNESAVLSVNATSEKPSMIDASTQTEGVLITEGNETKQESSEQSTKSEKPVTVAITRSLVRKLVRKIWNSKLKNKMKKLDEVIEIWKTHPCCNGFKSALKYLGVHSLYNKNCKKEVFCDLLRNGFIKSRHKSKMMDVKKRISSWKVEDSMETDAVTSQSQYLHGYYGKVNNFVAETPIYNYLTKMPNNVCLPPSTSQQWTLQHRDWISNQRIDYMTIGGFLERTLRRDHPDSVLLHEVCLSDFKKESLSIDNYRNCNKPSFDADCDMLDVKDVPKSIIHCDSHTLNAPENDQFGKTKTNFNDLIEDSCASEAESVDIEKLKLVPRRSSRIKCRNNQLKLVDSPQKYESNSPSPQILNISNSSDEVFNRESSPVSISPGEFSQCENSASGPKNLKKKYELLFGEFTSPEPTEIISDNFNEISPENMILTPKITYNLRRRRVNTEVDENVNSSVIKKRMVSRLRKLRSSQTSSKTLVEDTFCPLEEDDKTVETQIGEQEKSLVSNGFLDSIMTAMTKQTEEFKYKAPVKTLNETEIPQFEGCRTVQTSTPEHPPFPFPAQHEFRMTPKNYCNSFDDGSFRMNFSDSWNLDKQSKGNCSEVSNFSSRKSQEGGKTRKIVENELRKFLKAEIKSVEEGEMKIKPCIAALEKASENIIASVIVAEVMANVDEELQNFDRPAPPLTQTQHRLMTILTILTNSRQQYNKIGYKILKTIWTKLFPEKFFWPDDSVEMASRFYCALCKKLNYFKGMWRFCFKAVSSMRQRWCIPIFVVFQVWPDILHDATSIQDNILVKTFVYVILHTPKSEDLRRQRQEEKILAIKHLLINFYNFEINITIEELTRQLFRSLSIDTPGSVDALIFVARCRHWSWIRKNIIPPLIENLKNLMSGKLTAECGFKTLEIIREISSVLPVEDNAISPSANDLISSLYQLLGSPCSNPNVEEMGIRALCSLGHHAGVKDILSALSNKFPDGDPLHVEIKKSINSSNQKRKQFLKNSKNFTKLEAKFRKKKQEVKKRKKVKKKPKVKVAKPEKIALENANASLEN